MKNALFLFIVALYSLLAQAANFQPISYEEFMLMERDQQNKVLTNMMEITVELEQNHISGSRIKSVNNERMKKIRSLYTKIHDLIISSAYAAPITTEKLYLEFAEQFNKALSENGQSDKCIYAGWISRFKISTTVENGKKINKGYCVHPSTLPVVDNLGKSYLRFKNICKQEEIACQPAIFGFKKGNSPICVPASTKSEIHNASAACLKEALNPSKDSDSQAVRFEKIKNLIKDGNSAAAKEMNAMYANLTRACVCSDGLKSINADYTAYMQPHQTCYGLLSSLKNIRKDCYPNEMQNSDELKFFESLNEKLIFPKDGIRDPWAEYKPTIEKFTHASFCKDPVKVQLVCIPKCKFTDGAIQCTFEDEKTKAVLKLKENSTIDSGKSVTVYDNNENSTECKIPDIKPEVVGPEPKYECSSDCKISSTDSAKRECKFSILSDGKIDDVLKPDPQFYNDVALDKGKNEVSIKFEINNKIESLKCLITPEKSDAPAAELAPAEKKITCSAKCESKEENKILCSEFSILEDGVAPKNLSLVTEKYEGEAPKEKSITVEYKINNVPGNVKCEFEMHEKEPEGTSVTYDLSLKIDETAATTRTLSALINEKSAIPEGHTLNWTRKDTGGLKFESQNKEEKSNGIPDGNGEVTKDKVESGIIATGKLKVTEPRKTEDYKVCASLLDKSSKVIKEKCEVIPKQAAAPTQPQKGGGRKLPPPPQPMNRGNGVGTGYGGII